MKERVNAFLFILEVFKFWFLHSVNMISFFHIFKKKQKPIYSIQSLIIKNSDGLINYDSTNKIFTVHAKPINSNIVQVVKFTDWKDVKVLFDKDSRRIIEGFIKNVGKNKEIKSLH